MSDITNFPLYWPNNVARTAPQSRRHPQFDTTTITNAVNMVLIEINRLNRRAWNTPLDDVIISSNLRPKLGGLPAGQQAQPADPGVAVYFPLKFVRGGKEYTRNQVMACDKWIRVEDNIKAIAKHIESQRAQFRWGCGSVEQAFAGYVAIPEKCGGDAWWTVLGIQPSADRNTVEAAYKKLAQTEHPDKGGSQERWLRLQNAYEQAKQ